MGLFRELVVEVPCAKCGARWQEHIQFKTDYGDWDQVYMVGASVSDLPMGEKFEGAGILYCKRCLGEFILEEVHETFEAICSYIEQGRMVVKHPTAGVLGIAAIRGIAKTQIISRESMWKNTGGWSSETWPDPKPTIVWDGVVFDFKDILNQAFQSCWSEVRGLCSVLMQRRGWPFGSEWIREDIEVFVDSKGQIRFECANEPRWADGVET